ncbi:MAG: nucleoside triphosphate pyrophosphohydrolase [Desulfarculus sp.]|nr:nucleoside triphosphate pyrophosphohydrolase [Desulfarculus sp.]
MPPENPRQPAAAALVRLMDLVSRLRAPDGCPWDRKQTLESVANYLLEEAHEAAEALQAGDQVGAAEELGDLTFHVVFLAEQLAQAGGADLAAILAGVEAKMIRRHPHVFGGERLADAEAVLAQWGRIKAQERGASAGGLLDSLPKALPALMRAQRLGQRAARVGFDWPEAAAVWDKVAEEMEELRAAATPEEELAELGDLLFALVQWARLRGHSADQALRAANRRFHHRFAVMERLAAARGTSLERLDAAELDALWEKAKAGEADQEQVN